MRAAGRSHRGVAAAGAALSLLLFLTSCSGDDSGTTEAGAAEADGSGDDSPSRCGAKDDLERAVAELREVDVATGGKEALGDAVADVSSALDDLADDASNDLAPSIDAFRLTLDNLEATLRTLEDADSVRQAAGLVGTQLVAAAEAANVVRAELDDACP